MNVCAYVWMILCIQRCLLWPGHAIRTIVQVCVCVQYATSQPFWFGPYSQCQATYKTSAATYMHFFHGFYCNQFAPFFSAHYDFISLFFCISRFFFCSVSHFPQTHDSDRMPYYSVLPVMCAQHMRDAMQAGALTYHSNAYLACCSSLADTRQSRLERTNERPTEFNCIVLARCRRFEWLAVCVCSLCIVHVHMWSIVVPSDMSGVVKSVPILYGMLRCCVVDGVYAKYLDASRRCALAFVLMQPSVNLFTRTYKSITKMAMNCAEQRIPRVQVQGWLMNHESWIHEVLSWLTS